MITMRKSLPGKKGAPWASMTSLIKAIDAGVLLILFYMLVTFLCVLLRFFNPATANASQFVSPVKPEQGFSSIREGHLLLEIDGKGSYAPAPMLKTRADLKITGIVANVQVFQDFTNPTDTWLEGIYVFPLPDDAAVYRLRMHIGERIIEGIIKEREEAKKAYEEKKEEVRAEVVKTALAHNLVSRYTSMLAVDTTPTRPIRINLQKALATKNLPEGWIYSKVFQLPQTATVADLCFVLGLLSMLLAVLASLLVIHDWRAKR